MGLTHTVTRNNTSLKLLDRVDARTGAESGELNRRCLLKKRVRLGLGRNEFRGRVIGGDVAEDCMRFVQDQAVVVLTRSQRQLKNIDPKT